MGLAHCSHARMALAVVVLGWARGAQASDGAPPSPVLIEVTETASTLYNFDNRDTRPGQVASVANDHYGMFYNRLNLQLTRGRLTASLRADNAWFFASPTPESIVDRLQDAERATEARLDASSARTKLNEAGIELSNRFINWMYPAKFTVSYGTPDLEVAVGDSYAQLGRGLVLSLRKLDELSSDTTLRGVRLGARFAVAPARVKVTLLGGSLNPLRIDEASGRYLGVDSSTTPGFVALTEAGMPRAITTDFVPSERSCAQFGTCSFAPDRLLAGQAEISFSGLTASTQASVLFRQPALTADTVRSARRIVTASQAFDLPTLGPHGSAYLEVALQRLQFIEGQGSSIPTGYAVYGSGSWNEPSYSLSLEGKHYRRFFPLLANISTARAREFSQVGYSTPPTTEEIWVDTELGSFNTCVSGGRLKGEAHPSRSHSVFAWASHYRTWAESVTNDRCQLSSDRENRVWDLAVGLDSRPTTRNARWVATSGVRFDGARRELPGPDGPTSVFYRELYLRYQVSEPIKGPFALELQGVHRRRRETVGGPADVWFEGQHSTGIDWSERLSVAFGVEYDTHPGVPHTYYNGMLTYRPSNTLSLALFAGQRRGALRCVGGVCRIYPPFEGMRLDATVRF